MSRNRNDNGSANVDAARDELFSHIHRCGVLQASPEQQVEWLDDTVGYLGERYPDLGADDLEELKAIGLRFCQPVIPHGKGNSALTAHDTEEDSSAEAAAA